MYRSKEAISGFGRTDGRTDRRTDGRTDGQPENIMPPAPKGGGIKIYIRSAVLGELLAASSYFRNNFRNLRSVKIHYIQMSTD